MVIGPNENPLKAGEKVIKVTPANAGEIAAAVARLLGTAAGVTPPLPVAKATTRKGAQPKSKTVRAAIRASVPDGKLKAAKILLSETSEHSPIGGFTEWDAVTGGKVVKIGAPKRDNAFGIAVRGHETRHATKRTPRRKKPMTENEAIAGEIVDDVEDETSELPAVAAEGLRTYKRAHLAVALRDVRNIVNTARGLKAGALPDKAALRNANILSAVRAVAMLQHYGTDSETPTRTQSQRKIMSAIGSDMFRAVREVVRLARSPRMRSKAIGMLVALLEKEEDPESEDRGEPRDGGEILSPVTHGDALDGKMTIRDLRPKSVPCAREKRVSTRYAPNGVILNATRYVSAVTSGDANGLFSRRVRNKAGGCVVIDASGSMGATKNNLSSLCALVPTATVGFYSGSAHGKGDLCVYAAKGKRYNSELPDEYLHGGNAVDLPAIKWLMKHSKPWVLVSDLEFCGGVMGSETVAHALVERAVRRGHLKVYRSLDEAYHAFGGKGLLRN